MKASKLEAAKALLDFTIRHFFAGENILALFTSAGAAHVILHDLAEKKEAGASWASQGAVSASIEIRGFLNALRKIPNWLKHADKDPLDEIEVSETDLEYLLFHAVLDLGEFQKKGNFHSNEVSVFQLWFIAKHVTLFSATEYLHLVKSSQQAFGHLAEKCVVEQLAAGLNMLREFEKNA